MYEKFAIYEPEEDEELLDFGDETNDQGDGGAGGAGQECVQLSTCWDSILSRVGPVFKIELL